MLTTNKGGFLFVPASVVLVVVEVFVRFVVAAVVKGVEVSGIDGVVIGVVIDVVVVIVVVVVVSGFDVGDFVVNLPTKLFTASFTFGKNVKNKNGADEEVLRFSDLLDGAKTGDVVLVDCFVVSVVEIKLLLSDVEMIVVCSSVSSSNFLLI